ncbi:MAG TPA: hypothetical protein VK808_01475 [Bacteroidia bacterium]|jgi:hypothetical protein|nr:hypothetical protein [Bacteroidia bacterium]
MFQDKKLKKAFLLQLLVVLLPVSLLVIANIIISKFIGVTSLALGFIGLFVSIGVLRQFIRNWKIWNPASVKITGITLAVLGILLGIYAILGIFTVLTDVGGNMIG